MFFPGETATHRFVVPFPADDIACVTISYKQNDDIVLEKTITSGFTAETESSASFSYELTQQESLLFEDAAAFTLQCNLLTNGGSRHTSNIVKRSSGEQYLREVMSNG